MNEHPDVYKKIFKIVMPGAYVAGRMAGLKGEDAFIDRIYMNFSVFPPQRGSGLNLRWFRDELACCEKKEATATGEDIYERVNRRAEALPMGSDKLLSLPHLAGRTCPNDPNMRGLYLGLTGIVVAVS